MYFRLMMDRIIFGTGIDDQIAKHRTSTIILESADSNKDIQIYLNSPWKRLRRIRFTIPCNTLNQT
jgi:ATP-dependent protease ClpP protease subunit